MQLPSVSFTSFCQNELDQGACLVVRLDLNVPRSDGRILDKTRINMAVDTLKLLKNHRLVLLTHWGRPQGPDPASSVAFLVPLLRDALQRAVVLAKTPEDVKPCNSITLLENLRFFPGEASNDPAWSQQLAHLGNIYMNEAFSASHRAHASIVGVPQLMPSYTGPSFEKEWQALETLRHRLDEDGSVSLIGGSKVSTKIGVLKYLLKKCDHVMIGGGMGHTFLAMLGVPMELSFFEEAGVSTAKELWDTYHTKIVLPVDGIERDSLIATSVPQKSWGDIGPRTLDKWRIHLEKARTVFWNGPMGIYEQSPLDQGSRALAQFLDRHGSTGAYTVVGGGDTLAVAKGFHFSYASPSGGAFLEALEKGTLPGIDALITN